MRDQNRLVYTDDNGDEVQVPHKWVICHVCGGEGKQALHGLAITAEEFYNEWDDDSREMYLNGGYDTMCPECGGSGKLMTIDEDRATPEAVKMYEAEMEAIAEMRAMEAAERAAGC